MAEDVRRIFAENLRRLMDESGKSQADMARYFSISTATASDWYNGRKIPRADKLQAIADWLGVGLGDILMEYTPEAQQGYYVSKETADVANEILHNSDMRILFDAAKGADAESLRMAAAILAKMKGTAQD
jgi:transcriptional regulator with XRE-family HTH domain